MRRRDPDQRAQRGIRLICACCGAARNVDHVDFKKHVAINGPAGPPKYRWRLFVHEYRYAMEAIREPAERHATDLHPPLRGGGSIAHTSDAQHCRCESAWGEVPHSDSVRVGTTVTPPRCHSCDASGPPPPGGAKKKRQRHTDKAAARGMISQADSVQSSEAARVILSRRKQHVGAGGDHALRGCREPHRGCVRTPSFLPCAILADFVAKFHRCGDCGTTRRDFSRFCRAVAGGGRFDVMQCCRSTSSRFLFASAALQRLQGRAGLGAMPDFERYAAQQQGRVSAGCSIDY